MIKLRDLYNEIRVIKEINPNDVLKLWAELVGQVHHQTLFKVYTNHYGFNRRDINYIVLNSDPIKLKEFYQDLVKLKNS